MKRFNRYSNCSWVRCWSSLTIHSHYWGWHNLLTSIGSGPRGHSNIFGSYHRSIHWSTDI